MGKHEKKHERKLTGPWRSIHGAIWLIGLAILAIKGWWWPGILILIAISMILEAVLSKLAPDAFEETQPETPPSVNSAVVSPVAVASTPEHRAELLPAVCPKCGGPIRGHEVKWTGNQSADCPFCGANLPMRKTETGASR